MGNKFNCGRESSSSFIVETLEQERWSPQIVNNKQEFEREVEMRQRGWRTQFLFCFCIHYSQKDDICSEQKNGWNKYK